MMTHLVPLGCAVVEGRGRMLIHRDIVAREPTLPCVNGIAGVVDLLQDGDFEVDLERVGAGHRPSQPLSLSPDLLLVYRQSGAENDRVHPMKRRSAKSGLVRERRERRGGRIRQNEEKNVEALIHVLRQADLASFGSPSFVGQVQVASAGNLAGKDLSAHEAQLVQNPIL